MANAGFDVANVHLDVANAGFDGVNVPPDVANVHLDVANVSFDVANVNLDQANARSGNMIQAIHGEKGGDCIKKGTAHRVVQSPMRSTMCSDAGL